MTLAIIDGGTGATTAAAARANLSTDLAANVNFMASATGAVTETVEFKLNEQISVRDFGALGDGSADDTAAFNLAIAYANAKIPYGEAANNAGTTIFIPDGRYNIGELAPISRSGVYFLVHPGATLLLSHDGVTFTWDRGARPYLIIGGGIVGGGKIEYLATPDIAAVVAAFRYSFRIEIECKIENVGTLLELGSGAAIVGGVRLRNVVGSKNNVGSALIRANSGTGLYIDESCSTFISGVDNPTINRISSMTTASGCNFLEMVASTWDTAIIRGVHERYWIGVVLIASEGMAIINIELKNSVFDYISSSVLLIQADAGGTISTVSADGAWLASWSDSNVTVRGEGAILNISACSTTQPFSGLHGIVVTAPNAVDLRFNDNYINASNRLNLSTSGITIGAAVQGFTVRGNHVGIDGSPVGLPWQAAYGVYVVADAEDYSITDNNSGGVSEAYHFEANTAGSLNRRVRNNRHANYAGNVSGAPYVLPATGSTWVNKTGFTMRVILSGGTVSAIAQNGVSLGLTAGTLTLDPGETFAITYAAAPNVVWFVAA